jgi:demethylsterigmatocystin 6-O-methyltransferase
MVSVSAFAMRKLIAELKVVKANLPQEEALRKELYAVTRDLTFALEDESDSINRIVFTPLQPVAARVGSDLDLFSILAKHDKPMTTAELAQATRADPLLLSRFLRYFDTEGMVRQVDSDNFVATNITKALASPAYQAGLRCCTNSFMRCWQSIPKYLAETKYANPQDMMHTPYQLANNTDLPAFVHFPTKSPPTLFQDFNLWMSAQFQYAQTWIDVFDMEQQCRNSEATTPIFVDIGGGIGHQCALLKSKLPHQAGRVVLQDLPMSIEHALPTAGVENTLFDFWTEQPVKGTLLCTLVSMYWLGVGLLYCRSQGLLSSANLARLSRCQMHRIAAFDHNGDGSRFRDPNR